MLKKLKLKNCFTHRDATFDFEEGLTAITGPNGRGKSLITEMIQFAYFGISALRGKAEDYKELEVEHEFFIRGKPYTIRRTSTKATLFDGHSPDLLMRASGTKPVNQAVRELFGYSQAVFQVANAINQKRVDEFCLMLPTARKKLVDETIGLSALDALVKWIAECELTVRAQISARSYLLVQPMQPVKPENFRTSAEITEGLGFLYAQRRERDQVLAVASEKVMFPAEVLLEEDDAKLLEYKEQYARFIGLAHEASILQKEINSLPHISDMNYTEVSLEEDDAKYEEYCAEQQTRSTVLTQRAMLSKQYDDIPLPQYSKEQLDAFEAALLLRQRFYERLKLLSEGIAYHCENCQHDGHMHDPRVQTEYADVPDEVPLQPPIAQPVINQQRRVLEQQAQKLDLERQLFECEEFLSVNPDREDRKKAILEARKAVAANEAAARNRQRYDELMAKRSALAENLVKNPDCSKDIVRIENCRTAFLLAEQLKKQALEKQKIVDEAKAKLATFPLELDSIISSLEISKNESLVYETNLAAYEKAKVVYDAEMVKQAEMEAELKDWANGKQAVGDLRTKIKGFLLPSLNKVASYLINEFTGGELSWLVVNDDFEVIVEGQRVETLSGAGLTVANLAIRIGLGQVLTNQVFPVLMLDEADESCDASRAAYIEKMLVNLKSQFKQIIQITHKSGRAADHRIQL